MESEGSFEFGIYWREVDDIHSVVQHFHEANRRVMAIIGHSKGLLCYIGFAIGARTWHKWSLIEHQGLQLIVVVVLSFGDLYHDY